MSFEEARNSLVISFAEGSISEEEFLILYHEYESVNPFYPYWEFDPGGGLPYETDGDARRKF